MVKYFIVLFFPLYLFSYQPDWYLNIKPKTQEIIGFGKDVSLEIAKENAIDMIRYSSKDDIISYYLTQIKKVKIKGIWYVAYSYSTKDLYSRIYDSKSRFLVAKHKINPIIKNSPLYRKITYKIKFKPNVNLTTKDNLWYLNIDGILFYLDKSYFPQLFSNIKSDIFSFKINKRLFQYPDYVSFSINTKKEGYFSILHCSDDGKVQVLIDNEFIKKEFYYPKENEERFIMFNKSRKISTELFIAIFSKIQLDLNEFQFLQNDDKYNNFHKLLTIIKENRFSTIKFKVKPDKKGGLR